MAEDNDSLKTDDPAVDCTGAGDEAIRRRAYEIYESQDSGTAEENWVKAEAELSQQDDPAT